MQINAFRLGTAIDDMWNWLFLAILVVANPTAVVSLQCSEEFIQNVVCDVTCPAEGDEAVFLPDSTGRNCARYYICSDGTPQPAECSSMQYFDLVTGTCTTPADALCRVQGVTCPEDDELIANPESCSSFYMCEAGFPHFRECAAEHYFSNGLCVPGDCAGLVTDETEGTTEDGTTDGSSAITTDSPSVTPEATTDSPSTISTELPFTTAEITPELSTVPPSTVPTPTDSPSTISTEPPPTTPEITTEFSTVTDNPSTVSTESSTTPEVTTELSTVTDNPSTVSTESPTTPEITTEFSTVTDNPSTVSTESSITPEVTTEFSTVTDNPSTVSTESPTTPEITTELSTVTDSPSTVSTESSITPEVTTELSTVTDNPSTVSTESSTTPEITTASAPTVEPSTVTNEPSSTVESTTATDAPPSTDPAVVCQGVDIGVLAHPFNCYQYFVCIFSAGALFSCAQGQIFDPRLICVAGSRETCVPTRPTA
ncbi:AAEL012966-PA [Aedes aegypti]|uniref:AAEL012966-PA n=1 Tax=Aedes aegypti TaxID=7159 RepID=Q16KJ1_AEDAE|nr:AAEL012966-PA [Aedes aegypti]